MVRRSASFLNSPQAQKILKNRGFEVGTLVRVYLERGAEEEDPVTLESEKSGFGAHVGEGDGYYEAGKEIHHKKDDFIAAGANRKGIASTDEIEDNDLVFVGGVEGFRVRRFVCEAGAEGFTDGATFDEHLDVEF